MVMLISSVAGAQSISESVKLTIDQVPIAVKKSYEKEFGALPQDGTWKVRITKVTDRGRVSATPLWYEYTKRNKKEKIDVRFSPEGVITLSKGKPKEGAPASEQNSTENTNSRE